MTTAFAPVKFGSITIRDPVQLLEAFPKKEAYNAILEYFPATKSAPPIQTIPDGDADILIKAFLQRIRGLRSVSPTQMSRMNGLKNIQMIAELIHLIAQLRQRGLSGTAPKPSKRKKATRQLIEQLSGEQRRTLVFKLLWDLFHITTKPEEVIQAWETVLTDVTRTAPYDILIKATNAAAPKDMGGVDLSALSGTDEASGLAKFSGSTTSTSPADQLKIVYAVSHLFNFTFDDTKPANVKLIEKLSEILNAYAAFYSNRFPTIIRVLVPFYKTLDKTSIDVDSLLKLYNIIMTLQKDNTIGKILNLYLKDKELNGSIVIRITGVAQSIPLLIKAYSKFITDKGEKKTNQVIRSGSTDLQKLYALNVFDTYAIQIIAGSQMNEPIFNKIPSSYSSEENAHLNKNRSQIEDGVRMYFKNSPNSTLYLVVTPSKLIEERAKTEPIVKTLLIYNVDTRGLDEGIPFLKLESEEKSISLIAPDNSKYIDVQYKPTQVYQSFTLPIMQLFTLTHLKETLKPAAT